MNGARRAAKAKALVLGGLAASAALGFGLFFAGIAWFIAAMFLLDDHRTSGAARTAPTAVFAFGMLISSLVATRFGLWVGRDWYRNGR